MSRREKQRRMRRMLAGLFASAAVLVPVAPAATIHDDPAEQATIQALSTKAADEGAFVRGDGPDGAVVAEPVLRRDAPDGIQPATYSTAAPQSADSGLDWSATGLGAGTAALLLILGYAGLRLASRGDMARA